MVIFHLLYRIISGYFRDLLFQSFNGGEEAEDHQKNQDKTGQDDCVDVSFYSDNFSYLVWNRREKGDYSHSAPDCKTKQEFVKSLAGFSFGEFIKALDDHYSGEYDNQDLIEMEIGEIHGVRKFIKLESS